MIPRRAVLTTIVFCLLGFEVLVLAMLMLFPYVPDPGFANLNMNVYVFLAPLSTIFLLGLLYAWLLRLGTRELRRHLAKLNFFVQFLAEPFGTLISSIKTRSLSESASTLAILSRPRLMLAISLVASVLLALVPYRLDLNPTGTLVGIDSPLYVTWISQMVARPLPQALQYSFVEGLEGSRPFILIPLYLVALTGISPSQIIEYLPMFLAPLLSLSSYIFVRIGKGSASLAGLTALFTPVSFHITVGLWGGYYANWLALIIVYPFLASLLLFSKSPSPRKYAATFALSLALFLTHPWTWVLMVATCLLFAVSISKETGRSIHLRSMTGIIIAGIALDLLKSNIFATRTVAADLATKLPNAGQMASLWTNLVDALLYTHGGLLGDWIILALGLLAMLALRFKDRFERLILLWIGVASVPFLVLDSYHQARILYDLPIPVLMSTALLFYSSQAETKNIRWTGIIIVLILVLSANYALQGILLI